MSSATPAMLHFFCLLTFLLGIQPVVEAQYRSEAPILIIDEDFTDGTFDDLGSGIRNDSWQFSGTGKVLFAEPNQRDFAQALVRYPDFEGSAWSGAQWRRYRDLPWEHVKNQICFDKKNDVPVLRFRAFSDFSHSKHFAGVEVAMLEQRAALDGDAHYGHDLSFEAEQTFWATSGVVQLDANVENTSNWNVEGLRLAHFLGEEGIPTLEDLNQEYDNEIIWRNKPGTGKCNIETWGSLNNADFDVNSEMNAELDPDNPLGMFSLIQITLFRDNIDNSALKRPGISSDSLQIGILNVQVGITRRSDFNLDFHIDEADLDILDHNWEMEGAATIKEGDANNDSRVDFDDVPALLAYWGDAEEEESRASASYDASSGELSFDLDHISYIEYVGPAGSTSGIAPDWSPMQVLRTRQTDHSLGAFSLIALEDETLEAGAVLQAGLDPSELKWIVNYPGSGQPNGYELLLSEELFIKHMEVCPGEKEQVFAGDIDGVSYEWESASGILLRDRGYWADLNISDQFTGGLITARGKDGEDSPLSKYYFQLTPAGIPKSPGPVLGPESMKMLKDTLSFQVESGTAGLEYQWDLPETFTIIDGAGSPEIIVVATDPLDQGEIRVRVLNKCKEGNWSDPHQISVESTLGLNENFLDKISIYPNPVRDQLIISTGQHYSDQMSYRIISIFGAEIQGGSLENLPGNRELMIQIGSLQVGAYLLDIKTNKGRIVKQFYKY